ncbi:MAG: LUD domain-containing protein [Bacteroidota bacterium]|nr:LUD domain-containing protein [Bacteroidota bacterium]
MNSRDQILAAVKKNQPALQPLPALADLQAIRFTHPVEKFTEVLTSIGADVRTGYDLNAIATFIDGNFTEGRRFLGNIPGLPGVGSLDSTVDTHTLEDLEVFVLKAGFGVAENGAVWVTDAQVQERVLPFICQHLVVILDPATIVNNMHEAYERIGNQDYHFGLFIAGPSKTADIEQSLVLGAHGPKTMTLFLNGGI